MRNLPKLAIDTNFLVAEGGAALTAWGKVSAQSTVTDDICRQKMQKKATQPLYALRH